MLSNIPKESPAYREELFGPVASVFRVKNIDEAIQVANYSRFGLGASAWTNDPAERERFANEIDAARSSSTRWWLPIPAFLLAALGTRATDANWESREFGNS